MDSWTVCRPSSPVGVPLASSTTSFFFDKVGSLGTSGLLLLLETELTLASLVRLDFVLASFTDAEYVDSTKLVVSSKVPRCEDVVKVDFGSNDLDELLDTERADVLLF